mmetsp:Transcript_14918/g.42381  ORF Transcript_14918/g.42381 Transcript_14918/m.42381 type:complete len:215 (-) Transcript_14918:123-767(-)
MEGDAADAGPRDRQVLHTPEVIEVEVLQVRLENHVGLVVAGAPGSLVVLWALAGAGPCNRADLPSALEFGLGQVHADGPAPHREGDNWDANRLDQLLVELGVPQVLPQLPKLVLRDDVLEIEPLESRQKGVLADESPQLLPLALGASEQHRHDLQDLPDDRRRPLHRLQVLEALARHRRRRPTDCVEALLQLGLQLLRLHRVDIGRVHGGGPAG